jgi:hypothetical protein
MASNFLGDVRGEVRRPSAILSASELIAREGFNLQKGMNFRDTGGQLAVFLVLSQDEVFTDEWNEDSETYVYQGHDSTTTESGKLSDQIAMYPDGRVTDNGKFYKAAHAFKDDLRREPLQVQIYEKLDPGVWFDKGIFNLTDAKQVNQGGRKVFKFYLNPAGNREGSSESEEDYQERMLSAAKKVEAWGRDRGRCAECGREEGLRFTSTGEEMRLACEVHSGRGKRGLL